MEHEKICKVCVKAVIKKEDRILIVKRSMQDEYGAGDWEFPGGRVEFAESCEEALIREIFEEISLEVVDYYLMYVSSFYIDTNTKMYVLNYSVEASGNVKLSKEHTEYRYVSLDEAKEIVLHDVIEDYCNYINKR